MKSHKRIALGNNAIIKGLQGFGDDDSKPVHDRFARALRAASPYVIALAFNELADDREQALKTMLENGTNADVITATRGFVAELRTRAAALVHEHRASCEHQEVETEVIGGVECNHCGPYFRNTRYCPHTCVIAELEVSPL